MGNNPMWKRNLYTLSFILFCSSGAGAIGLFELACTPLLCKQQNEFYANRGNERQLYRG